MDISLLVPAKPALCKNVRPRSRPSIESRSYNFLRMTHSIHGGGINPTHPELKRAVYCRNGRFVVLVAPAKFPARAADGPGAEANGCDGQIVVNEAVRFHVRLGDRFRFRAVCSHRLKSWFHGDRMLSFNSPLAGAIQATAVCRAIDSR